MAFVMENLSRLPKDMQEKILEHLSVPPSLPPSVGFLGEEVQIEINDQIYTIPRQVFELIHSLSEQIGDLSHNEIPEDQGH